MNDDGARAVFRVGRGIADITGESSDCGMLGYGKSEQQTDGIHLRLRSRAFVFEDANGACVLLVVAELPLVFDSIHREVLERLRRLYGDRYTARNVMITATHTHCGPGGYAHHHLYNATTGGFRPDTFAAIVDGVEESIDRAHADLADARVRLGDGELRTASCNRSPSSFARNPAADRAAFPDGIDPQTTVLSIEREGVPVGAINWFATHGTSLSNTNTLISGDNKGYAAYHWERMIEGVDYLRETEPSFIAAFAQTNSGDMSPNLHRRPGSGPTEDEFENTRIIGERQYAAAAALAGESQRDIGGGVDARVEHVNLSRMSIRPEFAADGRTHRTGSPVAGAAALAGTDEGAGLAGFRQGRGNRPWSTISALLYRRFPDLAHAHAPKEMVLPGGMLNKITPLVAETYPIQLLRIGRLHLIGIPGEVTIVAGLRLRRAVASVLGADLRDVLVAGYANGYFHYVTTPEEYDEQRYEGGSTLFGRWQLAALIQSSVQLAEAMRDGRPVSPGAIPVDHLPRIRQRRPKADAPLEGRRYGDVLTQPSAVYRPGDRVRTTCVAANPNNDLHRGGSYLEVERAEGPTWRRIADDGDWATSFRRTKHGRATTVEITWDTPLDTVPGTYRIRFHGSACDASGVLTPFTATTSAFTLQAVGEHAGPPLPQQ